MNKTGVMIVGLVILLCLFSYMAYKGTEPDKFEQQEIRVHNQALESEVELQAVTPENVKIYRVTSKKTIVPIFIAVDKEGKVTNLR